MSSFRLLAVALVLVALPISHARADGSGSGNSCSLVTVDYTPADNLQVVAWVEDAAGNYVDTIYITQETGTYGIGNRPGRFDFNSGPSWPYGRRETTFPIWAHRHGMTWPQVVFQDGNDSGLSHSTSVSSREAHFCRPLLSTEPGWDTGTCASAIVYTDKGIFSPTATSLYPPRRDVTPMGGIDSNDVAMYAGMNPFDAVSQATPPGGAPATITWPTPTDLPAGNYVMWVEVSQEFDDNATYNAMVYPAPAVAYGDYGEPYRGQPSVVYSVPFTLDANTDANSSTMTYAGYGDPDGVDGNVRAPDSTISTDVPASGASRLQLVTDATGTYRVRVEAKSENDTTPPDAPASGTVLKSDTQSATISFIAPGDDGDVGMVSGYDIRVRANEPITDDNFADSTPVAATVTPDESGMLQTFQITGLLPSTSYWVGIRAYDDCRNISPTTIIPFTTADRTSGEVDACFIATAAYGSLMANEVQTLRTFRDRALRSTVLGELAVETYYTFGPEVAGMVGESELLRATARAALAPIVARVRAALR